MMTSKSDAQKETRNVDLHFMPVDLDNQCQRRLDQDAGYDHVCAFKGALGYPATLSHGVADESSKQTGAWADACPAIRTCIDHAEHSYYLFCPPPILVLFAGTSTGGENDRPSSEPRSVPGKHPDRTWLPGTTNTQRS